MLDDDQCDANGGGRLGRRLDVRLGPQARKIEQYWSEVRGNRLVPTRMEIDPRGMSGALSNAFVLERIAKGLARFRISGSHLTDLLGLEARGMPLSTVFVPEARQSLADALESAFDDPSIIRLGLGAETGFGRHALAGSMVLLPLRSDLGEVSRLLGGIEMSGEIGRAPRRLKIEKQERQGLIGVGEPVAGFIEGDIGKRSAAALRQELSSASRERSYLRLVVDNSG